MATAMSVARYIAAKLPNSGELQRQKLLYYCQAWTLVWTGRPLFPDRIEAWQKGPVVPSVWKVQVTPDLGAVSDEEKAAVDAVLEFYGGMSGQSLMDLTHEEQPWQHAWGGRSPLERGAEEIRHVDMLRFYTQMSLTANVPNLKGTSAAAHSDEVRDVAAAAAVRWKEALDLLAQ